MRKLFAGTIALFLLAAVGIGGAFAWTGSTSGSGQADAGQVSVQLYAYNATGNKVVPTGNAIHVARAGITNMGDIGVHVTGGSVSYTGNPICQVSGSVSVINGGTVGVGGSAGDLFDVYLTMGTGADDSCQNNSLPYDVTITVAS